MSILKTIVVDDLPSRGLLSGFSVPKMLLPCHGMDLKSNQKTVGYSQNSHVTIQ